MRITLKSQLHGKTDDSRFTDTDLVTDPGRCQIGCLVIMMENILGNRPLSLAHGADARLDPIHQAVARSIHARFLPVVVFSPIIGNRLQVSNQNPSFYSL